MRPERNEDTYEFSGDGRVIVKELGKLWAGELSEIPAIMEEELRRLVPVGRSDSGTGIVVQPKPLLGGGAHDAHGTGQIWLTQIASR